MRYVFDTSALLAHYRREDGWQSVQAVFDDEDAELILAGVSLSEFARRIYNLGATADEANAVVSNYQLLFQKIAVIDATTAKAAFIITCHTPQRLPLIDALIAAVAQLHHAVLLHRDNHLHAIPQELLSQQILS